MKVMVCAGPEVTPYFIKPSDAWKLLPGDGFFTCCHRGHVLNGEDVSCDKFKVHGIVRELLRVKDEYLVRTNQILRRRHLVCLSKWLSHGFQKLTTRMTRKLSREVALESSGVSETEEDVVE